MRALAPSAVSSHQILATGGRTALAPLSPRDATRGRLNRRDAEQMASMPPATNRVPPTTGSGPSGNETASATIATRLTTATEMAGAAASEAVNGSRPANATTVPGR